MLRCSVATKALLGATSWKHDFTTDHYNSHATIPTFHVSIQKSGYTEDRAPDLGDFQKLFHVVKAIVGENYAEISKTVAGACSLDELQY